MPGEADFLDLIGDTLNELEAEAIEGLKGMGLRGPLYDPAYELSAESWKTWCVSKTPDERQRAINLSGFVERLRAIRRSVSRGDILGALEALYRALHLWDATERRAGVRGPLFSPALAGAVAATDAEREALRTVRLPRKLTVPESFQHGARGVRLLAAARAAAAAPKHGRGILGAVERALANNPSQTTRELWNGFPNADDAEQQSGYEVYRDEERLVELEDKTGKERSIGFRAFQDYVKKARQLPRR